MSTAAWSELGRRCSLRVSSVSQRCVILRGRLPRKASQVDFNLPAGTIEVQSDQLIFDSPPGHHKRILVSQRRQPDEMIMTDLRFTLATESGEANGLASHESTICGLTALHRHLRGIRTERLIRAAGALRGMTEDFSKANTFPAKRTTLAHNRRRGLQ